MAKTTDKLPDEENIQVNYSTERTNLHDFGYTRAGNVQGDPKIFGSYLDRLMNGDLVAEDYKGLSESEKTEKRKKINELDAFLEETKKNNSKSEQEIKTKEKQVEEYRNEILQIRQKRAKNDEGLTRDSFSLFKFSINLFILIFLSGYLFFFYVSAAYKALYVDSEAVASRIAEGLSTGSLMPGPAELAEALSHNYLLFLVPFVFYAFGWAFHILLELKHKAKVVFIALLIIVTFIVDLLFALNIHQATESAKELMGLSSAGLSSYTALYTILFLGFVVYIIWSILLDSMIREWNKGQVTLNLKKNLKHLKKDIKLAEQKQMPIELVQKEIDHLQSQVDTNVEGNLKGYIDQFTTGWISYLAPESMKELKNKCLSIKDEFLRTHNIQPGVVKVIKPVRKIKI